jgi:hypothetical protein
MKNTRIVRTYMVRKGVISRESETHGKLYHQSENMLLS